MERLTVVVSIGRGWSLNCEGEPMWDEFWGDFRNDTFKAVEDYATRNGGEIVFFGDGVGVYEGKEEESYTVIASVPETFDVGLIPRLAELADLFGQESIALTITNNTSFVTPDYLGKAKEVGIITMVEKPDGSTSAFVTL